MMFILLILPILVVLAAKVMTQGVVVHRLQQPVPSVLLQVTYSASSNDDNNDSNDDYDPYRTEILM